MENIALRDTEQLLKATEIAHILNISRAMAYRLMQLGKIRTVSIGTAKNTMRIIPYDSNEVITVRGIL